MVALYVAAVRLSGPSDWRRVSGDRLQAGRTDRVSGAARRLAQNGPGAPLSPARQDPTVNIAPAGAGDADALLALRNHYIAHSIATFDEAPLAPAAVRDWMAGFADRGPYRLLVARDGDRLLGWCSSQPYRAHPAFSRTIETSVYVAPDAARSGVGSALYARLFDDLGGLGLHRAVVGIALPNDASVRLHTRFGFRTVGVFDEYAHKNGRAISSQWMQRAMDGGTA
jgi:phosphinothricin acetyltransferase